MYDSSRKKKKKKGLSEKWIKSLNKWQFVEYTAAGNGYIKGESVRGMIMNIIQDSRTGFRPGEGKPDTRLGVSTTYMIIFKLEPSFG